MKNSPAEQSVTGRHFHAIVGGQSIECRTIGPPGSMPLVAGDPASTTTASRRPALVFLHEGLGCVRMWRDFPDRVCAATGLPGLVYSRFGYGSSSPTGPRTVRFMHDEAIQVLPALLRELGIPRPILIGHSDGASIALIHAGHFPQADLAVAVLAPHLFVEEVCTTEIAAVAGRYGEDSRLREQLARYHEDVDGAFLHWTDIWLSKPFAEWTIEAEVEKIRCPLLAIQGEDDQYGTMRQIERIVELQPSARLVRLPDCRHSPHLDQPEAVIEAIAAFCRTVIEDDAGRKT